jgi:hypothetical protein
MIVCFEYNPQGFYRLGNSKQFKRRQAYYHLCNFTIHLSFRFFFDHWKHVYLPSNTGIIAFSNCFIDFILSFFNKTLHPWSLIEQLSSQFLWILIIELSILYSRLFSQEYSICKSREWRVGIRSKLV